MLRRAAQRDVPTVAIRVLSERFPTPDHRQIDHFENVVAARVESISRDREDKIRSFPLQVDGDYIGDHTELTSRSSRARSRSSRDYRRSRLPLLRDRRR